jgi:CheY-like chemotaxis protein
MPCPKTDNTSKARAEITDVGHTDAARKAKILLVDDRAENLLALEAILSSLEQELVFVRSGEAALDAVSSNEFAVILLDVVMPGMDGFETAARIKELGLLPNVPVFFLTAADTEPELAFRAYAAGAVDYISKPFDPWVLRAKVSVFVDLYLKDRQLQEVAALPSLLSPVEDVTSELACLPAALAAGTVTGGDAAAALADGLARLNDAVASLRAALSGLGLDAPAGPRGYPG